MSDSKQRKLGIILSYVSIFASTIVQLLYTPVLIGKLGQSEYGLYSLIASIIGYLTVLDLGFGNAIVVYTAKYRVQNKVEEMKKLHGMFSIIYKIIGFVAMIIGIILYLNVNNLFGKTMNIKELDKARIMMIILTINLVLTFSFNIYTSIISAYEKFIFKKIMSILNTLLKPILMIPLLFLGYKSIAMTIVITIVNITILLSNYFYCRKKLNINIKFCGFDKNLFKTIFGYSFFIFLGAIVDKANWSVDQFVLGATVGTIEVSIYSTAATLNQLFISLSTAISGVFLPKITKLVAKNISNKELTNEFIRVGKIQCYIIFLMASGLVIFGKQFIILWVGKEFVKSYYVALILIIPLCFELIQGLGLSILQANNKYKFRTITTSIMAIFNIIISIFLAKRYGAIGSAIGTAIGLIACNIIIINIYYYKKLKLDIIKFWKKITIQVLPLAIPIIIIIIIKKISFFSGLMGFVLEVTIYSAMYFLTSYFMSMNSYEKELVNNLFKKLHLSK